MHYLVFASQHFFLLFVIISASFSYFPFSNFLLFKYIRTGKKTQIKVTLSIMLTDFVARK